MKDCECGICENEYNKEMTIRVRDYKFLIEWFDYDRAETADITNIIQYNELKKRYEKRCR